MSRSHAYSVALAWQRRLNVQSFSIERRYETDRMKGKGHAGSLKKSAKDKEWAEAWCDRMHIFGELLVLELQREEVELKREQSEGDAGGLFQS